MRGASGRAGSAVGVRRYAPERELPPYAFVPGSHTPHPRRDPTGHAYGLPEPAPQPLDPGRWWQSADYRYAVDLLNHGYYWEAHEALEGLWLSLGKRGPAAELCKGLIKLAAAGVKVRQGMIDGARRHARGAAQHFEATIASVGGTRFSGLDLEDARALARQVESGAGSLPRCPGDPVAVVFPRGLELEPRRSAE